MKKVPMSVVLCHSVVVFFLVFSGCASNHDVNNEQGNSSSSDVVFALTHGSLTLEFDSRLYSRVDSSRVDKDKNGVVQKAFRASEYVETQDDQRIESFTHENTQQTPINSEMGFGREIVLSGLSKSGLRKDTGIRVYENFPSIAFFKVKYTNTSQAPISISRWVNNDYAFSRGKVKRGMSQGDHAQADFWSYEGASYEDRRDWVKPLAPGYIQENYMGMNASDYGSGTAIVDVWRKDIGLAVGHTDIVPKFVSLPLSYQSEEAGVELHIELEEVVKLKPGESLETIETFVHLHTKDYYTTLKIYRNVMASKGLVIDSAPDSAYEPIWCAWGYERNFNVDEVLATLPKAKELGLEWAVLDDGWQTAEGDWYLHPEKFPEGDTDMKAFVDEIKAAGLKAKLWWAPLAVDPGTDLLHEHSDMLLLDQDGAVQDVTWWNSFYLCPAYEPTREYTKNLVKKIMGEWGFAGLKIDGQHLNGVAQCHNPLHNHTSPNDSAEKLGEFWQLVYETAKEINPEAVVEICPCGTSYAFHNLPFMNQPVSSDPLSSWQVRHKGKTLKGLMGESAPYYGDHVELSDNASDFASSLGIGAVVGTKFTVGNLQGPAREFLLDAEKELRWSTWISLYNEKMLPKGEYLGEFYDIGFDRPETHLIKKDNRLYYAFYADTWDSLVEFRGLEFQRKYKVRDYVNGKDLGELEGTVEQHTAGEVNKSAVGSLHVSFNEYLLLELTPIY